MYRTTQSTYLAFAAVIGLLLLGGCSSPTATPTPTAITPTLTATISPTATADISPTVAEPIVPTATTSTIAATPDIAETVAALSEPRVYAPLLSPDGKWRAEAVIYDCVSVNGEGEKAYEQLRLIQVQEGVELVADSQLLNCGGLGSFGFAGLYWSPNSRYFYYTDAREGVPDGCGYLHRPVVRLDATNLDIEHLGGGPLSPDGTRIATSQRKEIVVWDINEGELSRIPAIASDAATGPIAWSPDNNALVYLQNDSYCPFPGKSYVVLIDLLERESTLLLESDSPSFSGASWDRPGMLRLIDGEGKQWSYTFTSEELKMLP